MKKLLLCFALGVFLFSCTKDDSPTDPVEPVDPEVTFFTFTLDNEDLEDVVEGSHYVLLNDNEGVVLGYEKLTEAKKYEFKAKKSKLSGSLLFTLLTLHDEGGEFWSWEDIPLYEDWSFSPREYKDIESIKFKLNVRGNQEKFSTTVSPLIDLTNTKDFYGSSGDSENEFSVAKSNKYFVRAIGQNNIKKYSFIEGIENGETRNLSYDRDFKNYDASVDVVNQGEYNSVNGKVKLIENSKGVIISDISTNRSLKLQLPQKDANYEIELEGFDSNQNLIYNYESRGLIPTGAIKMPKYNFTITDETFFDLKFTSDIGNYGVRETLWDWNNGQDNENRVSVEWIHFTNDKKTFKQPIIPEEIKSNFPKGFEISKLDPDCYLNRGLEYKDYVYEYILPASATDDTVKENYVKEWFKNK